MNLLNQRASDPDTTVRAPETLPNLTRERGTRWDVLSAAFLVGLVVAAFNKTVLFGLPISRIGLIAEWDSLFSALRRGTWLNIDPSAVLLALPTYSTIASQYHAGHLPLWNSLNAFGAPLVGDVQATVFSPLRILFNLFPGMYTYNMELVAQVVLAAVGTYLLCRTVECSRIASIGAAVSYSFCPFVLWYLELQSGVGFALNPLVFWGFARCARLGTARSAVVAGAISGATILMGHPETSFFAIVFGALLLFGLRVTAVRDFLNTSVLLGAAGLAAFATCAPTFLPFIEYAKNSDCYKYVVGESAFMPWQSLLINLCTPLAKGASPFLGVLCVPFALVAMAGRRRPAVVFGVLAALTFVLSAKLWPLSLVSKSAPFNYLITVYAVPLFALCMSVLFGIGLSTCKSARAISAVGLTSLLVAVVPFVLNGMHVDLSAANFDMTLGGSAINLRDAVRGLVVAVVCCIVLAASALLRRPSLIVAVLVALNAVALLPVSKISLPAQAKFELPRVEALEFLRNSGERCVAMGTHLAKPDVNLLYGIDDVRSINAMLPPRYISFAKACGATTDQFTQWFEGDLTPVADVGSVRYVLTQTPVVATSDVAGASGLCVDFGNRQILGDVQWDMAKYANRQVALTLVGPGGSVLWFGDRKPVTAHHSVRVPIPERDIAIKCSLNAQFFDASNGREAGSVVLASLGAIKEIDPLSHYKLRREFDGGVRVYENTLAVPRAYLVHDVLRAGDKEAALRLVSDRLFDAHKQVVIEGAVDKKVAELHGEDARSSVRLVKRLNGEVQVETRSSQPGVLVITDTFYPGWKAFIDGHRVPIARANYLFRGVFVPAGNHEVVMRYYPDTFTIGILFFFGFWLLALYAIARKAI